MAPSNQLVVAVAASALLASCAALKQADAPVTMRLAPTFGAAISGPATESVAVAPVSARGVSADRRYAYINAGEPAEIHQAATLFWEIPPANVIQTALIAGLRTRFNPVLGPDIVIPATNRLTVTLSRFEEVSAGGDSHALVAFDATYVRAGKVSLTGSYCASAAITDASPTARAHGFEQATTAAINSLVQDMAAPGRSSAGPC